MDLHGDVVSLVDSLTSTVGDGLAYPLISDFIAKILPGDDVMWTDIRFDNSPTRAYRRSSGDDPLLARALTDHGLQLPALQSYLTSSDLSPRRVSDICSESAWTGLRAYDETFAGTGERYQLSIVLKVQPPTRGRGWVVTRTLRDFTNAEVEIAERLHPLLVAVDHLTRSGEPSVGNGYDLTSRETQILHHLAKGATAARIGRELGLSDRTVGKHLEHIYAKLGCHDRLVAVDRARQWGLLPAQISAASDRMPPTIPSSAALAV